METWWTDTSLESKWRRHSKERSQNWLYHVPHQGWACNFQKWKPLIPVPEFRELNLFHFLPVPQFAISHICMGIKIERSGESECGRRSDWQFFLPLPTTSSLECNEREIIMGIRKWPQGAFQTIQNVYWNVSMSSHSPQSITIYDHIAITLISCQQITKILNHKTWLL